MLHAHAVCGAVRLRAQGVHGRTLAAVQHPVLDTAFIRRAAHFTAECVNFAHQMTFGRAADCRVAGHIAHRIQIDRKAHRAQTEPGGGKCRFNPCVPGADHGNIIICNMMIHGDSSLFTHAKA